MHKCIQTILKNSVLLNFYTIHHKANGECKERKKVTSTMNEQGMYGLGKYKWKGVAERSEISMAQLASFASALSFSMSMSVGSSVTVLLTPSIVNNGGPSIP